MLTETWLRTNVNDCELFGNDFHVYRCDRSAINSRKPHGGGVLIAVKKHIPSQRINVLSAECFEIVFVKLICFNVTVFLVVSYVPSDSDSSVYYNLSQTLSTFFDSCSMSPLDLIICVGDFNLPHVSWMFDTDCPSTLLPVNLNVTSSCFVDSMFNSGLHQLNYVQNFMGRILDLVFSSDSNLVTVTKCKLPLSKVDKFHDPLDISVQFVDNVADVRPNNMYRYNFVKADYLSLNVFLSNINWSSLFVSCDINKLVVYLYEIIHVGISLCVPLKTTHTVSSHPVWFTKSLINLKNKMNKAHKRYRLSLTEVDYSSYSKLRSLFKREQKNRYLQYLNDTQSSLCSNPSQFWTYVRSKQKSSNIPSVMCLGSVTANNSSGICDLFCDFFSNVYVPDSSFSTFQSNFFNVKPFSPIGRIIIPDYDVLRGLLTLTNNTSSCPDGIPNTCLVNCAQSLYRPLSYIFNRSLDDGIFPDLWKTSLIRPIFKSGSRNNIDNYRGICILSPIGKLFESLVTDVLTAHFKPYISSRQHGFMSGRSINTNLVEFVNVACDSLDKKFQLDVVYTDFSKAFDRVNHKCLIYKLSQIGVHSSLLKWLQSYLSDRVQYVSIDSSKSSTFRVPSGVPQGSHLGPLLFNLFINDVVQIFNSVHCLIYADDIKLFLPVRTHSDIMNFQRDLNSFFVWCSNNDLSLNVSKCKHMTFSRIHKPLNVRLFLGNDPIQSVCLFRDLGVWFTPKLSFDRHVELTVAKALSMLGFLKRICAEFNNINCLKSIYFAHVRSHLEFACVIWSPEYSVHIKRIESIQKKFVMYVLRKQFNYRFPNVLPPYKTRCEVLQIQPLSDRRQITSVMFVYDVLSNKINSPSLLSHFDFNVPRLLLRDRTFFRSTFCRTNYARSEPIRRICRAFNTVSHCFDFNVSRFAFKSMLIMTFHEN